MLKGSGSRLRFRRLEELLHSGIAGDLSDGELIERFLRCADSAGEAAFRALVERHGPMVFRVCRQALGDRHAAEDALQATFLVLARRAGAIRKRTSVSSWLFGVARRAAVRMRMEETRRRRYEGRWVERSFALIAAGQETADPDPYPELHAEIERLPEKYRVPIVLCYLEGLTHEQAASRLRWPLGTVKIRLSRARQRLRSRLDKPGSPSLLVLPGSAIRAGSLVEMTEHLINVIAEAGWRFGPSGARGGPVSSAVVKVSRGVMKSMLLQKVKLAGTVASGVLLLGFGAFVTAQQATEKGTVLQISPAIGEGTDSPSALRVFGTTDLVPHRVVQVRVPFDCRVDNVLVDLGQRVKKGDPVLELFSTDLAEAKSNYELAASQLALHEIAPKSLVRAGATATVVSEANSVARESRLKLKLAKDKLLVFGLSDKEIENAKQEVGDQKAKMVLRSRGEGVVVQRNVVRGNFYTSADLLMAIAPLDQLWVRGTVSELDAERVRVGQNVSVIFPYVNHTVKAKVEYVDPQIDHETHTVKIRTSIPNPENRYKPGMFVRMVLETEAGPGETHAPQGIAAESGAGSTSDRLSALERKLDRLLGEKEERLSHSRILDRLDALERKMDQLLNGRR